MVSLTGNNNMVTALAMFVLLIAGAGANAYILSKAAGNATYGPCRGFGDGCQSIAGDVEDLEVEFSQYYYSSRLLPAGPPQGKESHSDYSGDAGQTACGRLVAEAYKCCMNGGGTLNRYDECVPK